MKFYLKSLMISLGIIISISGRCVNATEQNINPINNIVGQNINVNNNLVNANAIINNNIYAIDSMIEHYKNKYNAIQSINNKDVQQQVLSYLSNSEQVKINICGRIDSKYVLRQIFLQING